MKLFPIARRYRLADTPHLLADADGVLSASALQHVTEASDLVRAVRSRCAAHLRASRRRHQQQLAAQRAACESAVLARAALLSQQLQAERQDVRNTAASLVAQVARDALQRLMVELPDAWPAQSSVQLVLAEWASLELKDEATLRVHPDDLPLVSPLRRDIPWTLASDATLARGVCVLSHSAGTVRADFSANLAALRDALRDAPKDTTTDAPNDAATHAATNAATHAATNPQPASSAINAETLGIASPAAPVPTLSIEPLS